MSVTQLIRVRNALVTEDDPKAFGYVVGKVPYQWDKDQLIVAWVEGTVEDEDQHRRNVAFAPPSVYITNEHPDLIDGLPRNHHESY